MSESQTRSNGAYPWTIEQTQDYVRANTRQVEVKGHAVARAILAVILRLARRLSWKGAYRLGGWIGGFLYLLRARRRIAMVNLDIVFGDTKSKAEKLAIYRASLSNLGRQVLNYMRVPLMDQKFWDENFAFVNEEMCRDTLNEGRGLLYVAGHLGAWELSAGKVGMSGYPISIVAKKQPNPAVDRLLVEARAAMNLGAIKHRDSMPRILDGLRNGEAVIMIIDQNMKRSQGIFLNWMGRPASAPRSTAWIARETGAPVLTGIARQFGPTEFALELTERIDWESHPDPDEELRINGQKQADAVQRIILRYPEEWFWLHRRWKVQPDKEDDPYR